MRGMGFGAGYSPRRIAAGGGGGASDPDFASVVFLSNFGDTDGATTFSDDSANNNTVTAAGNAQADTAIRKFTDSAAMLLDGSGDYAASPDSASWTLGAGDFTIEGWFYFSSTAQSQTAYLVTHWGGSGNRGWQCTFNGGATPDLLQFYLSTSGSNTVTVLSSAWTPTFDSWHHIVFERSGNTFRSYVDGSMIQSATNTSTIFDATTPMQIGAVNGLATMDGSAQEVRITKGVARYASDAGYTVPAAAFPRS